MKNNVMTIMAKEFARFFGDRRMLISLFLPGILIYVLYAIMGNAIANKFSADVSYLPSVYVIDLPASLEDDNYWSWAEISKNNIDSFEQLKEQLLSKDIDLLVVFPEGFDRDVACYSVTDGTKAPNIEIYYNGLEINSASAFFTLTALLDGYESSLSNKFDIDGINFATEEETSASFISMMMPMLIISFLFSGCFSIATESIAGEKERGTLGTLLVSPLKRSELALGKILSLGILAFLIGLVSSASTILSLPKLMGDVDSINVNIYQAVDYLLLALVILTTLLLFVSLISIISAFAKSVKEASGYITPLMVVVMVIGVLGMFSLTPSSSLIYLLPIHNSVQSMSSIFALNYNPLHIFITISANTVYSFIAGFILTKMFNSERIVFSK